LKQLFIVLLFISFPIQADNRTECRDAYRANFQAYLNLISNEDWARFDALADKSDFQYIFMKEACFKKIGTGSKLDFINDDPVYLRILEQIKAIQAQAVENT